jgi:MFS family permease
LVLATFSQVSSGAVGYYLLAFAAGNLLGPLIVGCLFDAVGRRAMCDGKSPASGVVGTGPGGFIGPVLIGQLIARNDRWTRLSGI